MMVAEGQAQSLAANLGAFMIKESCVRPRPCGVVGGETAFDSPAIVAVMDGGREIQTIKWRDCEISPIIRLCREGGDDSSRVDSTVGPYDVWDDVRRFVHDLRVMTASTSKKRIRKKAEEIGQEAQRSERRANRIRDNIEATASVSRSVEESGERISWRSMEAAASVAGGSEQDARELIEKAANAFMRSGMHYLLGGAPKRAAAKLSDAARLLVGLGRHDETAIWAETAWQLDNTLHDAQAKMAARAWLDSANRRSPSENVHFALSHSLQNAWSAREWDLYIRGMDVLLKLHEGRDDYANAAADYVRIAWALLQGESVSIEAMRRVVYELDNAGLAWELADMEDMSVAAHYYAKRAEKIAVGEVIA
jgi:hypothetical protein